MGKREYGEKGGRMNKQGSNTYLNMIILNANFQCRREKWLFLKKDMILCGKV
jgi:hypothetical protein